MRVTSSLRDPSPVTAQTLKPQQPLGIAAEDEIAFACRKFGEPLDEIDGTHVTHVCRMIAGPFVQNRKMLLIK